MPKFFVKNEQVNQGKINILGEDVNHIKNVLRMKMKTLFAYVMKIVQKIIWLKLKRLIKIELYVI